MIGRMFERIPAWATAAAAMVVIVVLIYAAGWWWAGWPPPRWRCDDGYWHWRGCDGHEDDPEGVAGLVVQDVRLRVLEPVGLPEPLDEGTRAEAALDEAWAWQLRRFNQDIKTSTATTYSPPFVLRNYPPPAPVIDWGGMSWRDRGELERWDWGRRMEMANDEWSAEWGEHGWRRAEHRADMGLAA